MAKLARCGGGGVAAAAVSVGLVPADDVGLEVELSDDAAPSAALLILAGRGAVVR